MAKTYNPVDKNGLIYFLSKLKEIFVKQEAGKTLSSNDYTTTEKTKLAGIAEGAEVNTIKGVQVNGVDISPNESTKKVNITVPTDNKTLTNGANYQTADDVTNAITTATSTLVSESTLAGKGYQTADDVSKAITNATKDITGIKFSVGTELPAVGENGTIYLMSNGETGNNKYNEFIYVNNSWEELGYTDIDLSGYLKASDITPVTNAEIDAIFS